MRNKPTIPQLIENLSFVKAIDLMLLEGVSATNVAKFIHDDQKALVEIKPKALINALAARKEALVAEAVEKSSEQTRRWFDTEVKSTPKVTTVPDETEADDDEEDEGDDHQAVVLQFPGGEKVGGEPHPKMIPSAVSRRIYERHIKGGIDELVELEALYRTQVHRLDRLIAMEESKNGYIENLDKGIKVANDLLMARVAVKKEFGLIDGDQKFREQLDIKGYSEKTVKTLANPESRHRVVVLMEKLAKLEERKRARRSGSSEG
jgi:hypothetical protein